MDLKRSDVEDMNSGQLVLAKILISQNEAYGRLDNKIDDIKNRQSKVIGEVGDIKKLQRSANHATAKHETRILALEVAARLKRDQELEWRGLMRVPHFFVSIIKWVGAPSIIGLWVWIIKHY